MANKQKTITLLSDLKEVILEAKDEKTAFDAIRGVKVPSELAKWFTDNYAYDEPKKKGFYKSKLPAEEAFSNLYFDVINDLI